MLKYTENYTWRLVIIQNFNNSSCITVCAKMFKYPQIKICSRGHNVSIPSNCILAMGLNGALQTFRISASSF